MSFKFFSVFCEARENYEYAISDFFCQNWLVIEIPITLLLPGISSNFRIFGVITGVTIDRKATFLTNFGNVCDLSPLQILQSCHRTFIPESHRKEI